MLHKTTSETEIFLSGHSLKKQALSPSKDRSRVCNPLFICVKSIAFLLGVWKGEWRVLSKSPWESCCSGTSNKKRQSEPSFSALLQSLLTDSLSGCPKANTAVLRHTGTAATSTFRYCQFPSSFAVLVKVPRWFETRLAKSVKKLSTIVNVSSR